jgi:hypothetical protein
MSKNVEFGKKTQGILGVKWYHGLQPMHVWEAKIHILKRNHFLTNLL